MKEIIIRDAALRAAAAEGMDAFVSVFIEAIDKAIGGRLDAGSMADLNTDQITLMAYSILRDEVMDGGFVQLIHNGYGGFIFLNPFAKVLRMWGMRSLSKLIYNAHTLYLKYRADIERECTEEEFMAMFEKYPEFDDMDDEFVENEEEWTSCIAAYIDDHIESFAKIEP
ncbi:DMP19 family protein [Xylanibacter muris]|uniref:DMP19 family protein n=1 Tax=Xylanibacter muris TaxID=2736290 RepID=A0ABX2AP65_9BACT|nr:DMP19 family protein [Xylanibacter muris]NPD93003.1 DMP19 family protein [Xylanibacter muris]